MEKQTPVSINVSEIMEGIRAEIKEKGYSSDMLSFTDVPLDTENGGAAERFDIDVLHSSVQYYTANHTVELERSVSGNPVSRFCKKIIRRLVRFYAEPYAAEQNSLNACAAQAQAQVEMYIQESRMHSTKTLLDRIEVLELQQKNARLEIEQMQNQIQLLQKRQSEEE